MTIPERIEALEARVDVIESRLTGASNDRPPEPPKTGRKYEGEKFNLRVRIDANLFELLKIDAERHAGNNLSKMLDSILWQHYGKPRLSFEESAK